MFVKRCDLQIGCALYAARLKHEGARSRGGTNAEHQSYDLESERFCDSNELHDMDQEWGDKMTMSYLTLTVLPRRPPQKGLIILVSDNTVLWAAILIKER